MNNEERKAMKFKDGDRVRSTVNRGVVRRGEIGTVSGGQVLWGWDNWTSSLSWWEDSLELVEEKRPREEILEEARNAIMGDREGSYGPPEESFNTIAKLWEAAEIGKNGWDAIEVAKAMVLFKIARLGNDRTHHDSLVDGIGYFANWHECVVNQEGVNNG